MFGDSNKDIWFCSDEQIALLCESTADCLNKHSSEAQDLLCIWYPEDLIRRCTPTLLHCCGCHSTEVCHPKRAADWLEMLWMIFTIVTVGCAWSLPKVSKHFILPVYFLLQSLDGRTGYCRVTNGQCSFTIHDKTLPGLEHQDLIISNSLWCAGADCRFLLLVNYF